ncbi:MAG: hypothetical protein QM764_04725 [Chitinophagaceae bacterium]
MMRVKRSTLVKISLVLLCAQPIIGFGQAQQPAKKKKKTEIYLSWGYNTETYTRSTIKISQPELNNHYRFINVKGHDRPGWNDGLFSKALSIPQYNYRLGFFFNDKNNLGFEVNFDHTKFIFADNQLVHIKGTVDGKAYDGRALFKDNSENPGADSSSYYYLNNGANFLLFNIMKRWHWFTNKKENVKIDAIAKAGIGPVIPHVENKFFQQPSNNKHFQLGGWNTGVEGALRSTFYKHVYLEFAGKLDYARYSGLKIYKGTAKQAFGTGELILSLGLTL